MLLATLIDPHSHQEGQQCLKLFAEAVLGLNPVPDLTDVRITREKLIENHRRIDIYIETVDCKIPIEVKLYADDQPDQCFDYIKYAHGADERLYYLSLDGHEPALKSVKNKRLMDKIVCISFSKHIMNWLELCQRKCSQSLQPVINQFRDVIEQNTGKIRERRVNMLVEELIKTPERFECAMAIAEAVDTAKIQKMTQVFAYIENHLRDKYKDYRVVGVYEERSKKYYKQKGSTWPSVNLLMTKGEYQFDFRIEIAEYPYFGLCNWREDKLSNDDQCLLDTEKRDYVSQYLRCDGELDKNPWWYWWENLTSAVYVDDETTLNFRSCKGLYTKLFDPQKFSTIMKSLCNEIDKKLEILLK